MKDWVQKEMQELIPEWTAWRRDFHRHPETGWTEYRTTAKIAQRLRSWGWKVYLGKDAVHPDARMGVPAFEELRHHEERALQAGVDQEWLELMRGGLTGVVAEWQTGVPGPVFAFRFDIDALNVREADEEAHLPHAKGFRSLHEGKMHACAHDGHATIGLALAQLVARHAERLRGTVRILFQPAEEGSRGARAMVAKGWLDDVDYFLSGHIGLRELDLGEVVVNTGGFFATTKWDVEFCGQSAHAGANPELGRNALLAASTAVIHLYAIARHSQGASRINVGRLEAGSGRNVIPDHAWMQLEVRGENDLVHAYMVEEAERILQAAAAMYGAEVRIHPMGRAECAAGDPDWAAFVKSVLQRINGIHTVHDQAALGASEDVTWMMKRVQERGGKATYLLWGTPLAGKHHQPTFDFDEQVISLATEGYFRTLLEVCGR